MSAAANEARAPENGEPAGDALVESAQDSHETHMTYNESSRVPWWVTAVWVCSMIGFLAYTIVYLFADLAKWGAP
jgi:hypothetical protein